MSDLTNELIRLGELREKGLITQEEFDAAKAKLLGQAADASDTGGPPPEMPPLEMPADMPSDPPQAAPQSRPSVLGKQVDDNIPPGIKGWSWGAFLLNWIWAIFNNTWIGLLALVPFVNLVMIFVLGAKGREWAWKNKKWDSVEHFNRVQRKWSVWAVWLFVIGFVLAVILTIASMVFMGMAASKMSSDFMEAMPTEVTDPTATTTTEDAATPMTEETAPETVVEEAAPLVAEDAVQDTTQAEPEVVQDAVTNDTAAEDAAAAEQARQQQAELARTRAEADAAKAEAAKAKKDALKAEKALAEQRRREREEAERLAAEEREAAEQEECPYSRSQPLTCSSRQGQPAYCDWNFRACGNPRIAKKESKTTCDGKVNWDTDSNQLIVTEGCRAQFVPVR